MILIFKLEMNSCGDGEHIFSCDTCLLCLLIYLIIRTFHLCICSCIVMKF